MIVFSIRMLLSVYIQISKIEGRFSIQNKIWMVQLICT